MQSKQFWKKTSVAGAFTCLALIAGCGEFYGLTERGAEAGAGGDEDEAGERSAAGAPGRPEATGGAGGRVHSSEGGEFGQAEGGEFGQAEGGEFGQAEGGEFGQAEGGQTGSGGAPTRDTSSVPVLFDGPPGGNFVAVAPELGISGRVDEDGNVSWVSVNRVSDTEFCAEAALTTSDDYLWVMLPFLPNTDEGETQYFDLKANGVTGFAFDVTSEPPGDEVRLFVSAQYQGGFRFFEGAVAPAPSKAELRLADLQAELPGDVKITLEEPHYQTGVHRLIWEVDGTGTEATHKVCISNLRILRD